MTKAAHEPHERRPSNILTRFSVFFSHDSTVRRANSNEHVGTLTRKDSGESKGNRTRTGSTGSNSSGKRSDR